MKLPDTLPGHWESAEGREMAEVYAELPRERLSYGAEPDLVLANMQYMASRNSLDLVPLQTAAKERIRWLSAQLALAIQALEAARDDISNVNGLNEQSIACTVWHSQTETTVDFIDAAIERAKG